MESRSEIRRNKLGWCENPERNLPNALSPFVIAMVSLHNMKCTGRYNLYKSPEKINHLMDIDRHQTVCSKCEKIGNKDSENKQWRYKDGICQGKMCHAEKRKTANDGRNWTTKSRKNQNAQRIGNLQILENVGKRTPSNNRRWKKKSKKNISRERKNYSKPNYIVEISSKG